MFEVNEYQIYFMECVETSEFSQVHSTSENFDVFNSLMTYLVFTEKRKLFFLFYTFVKSFGKSINHALGLYYIRRQRSICDRITGAIYDHREEMYSASKCETSDVINN